MPLSLLLDYSIRSTLLLGLVFAGAWLLRERSAAWRHLIWLAGLIALLALPAAKVVAPRWSAPVMLQSSKLAATMRTVIEVTAPARPSKSRGRGFDAAGNWMFAVWLGGVALLSIRMVRAQLTARRLVRLASPGPESGTLVTGATGIPMVCGLWRPVVVLPLASKSWPAERLESVLRHERMHVARRDTVAQAVAQLACVLYWPQPLVWLAASALRRSCEQACDDGVLSQGAKPSVYAQHLIEIARALQQQPHPANAAFEGGIAMTRTNQLEQRISALLNPKRDRRQAGASFAAAVTALAVTLVIGLAAIRTPLFAQTGKLGGVVRDVSGAVVPDARIDVRASVVNGNKSGYHEIVKAGAAGEFSLDAIPDGMYDISISAPGFARQEHQGVLFDGGKAKPMAIELQIGAIHEKVQVQAQGTPAAAAAAPLASIVPDRSGVPSGMPPKQIRVGGNVQAANLTKKVPPIYPVTAKLDGVEGTVILKAVIGKDGSILSLEQVNKLVDSRLAESATEAVKQWQYRPTLLNGEPVEVVTEIEINFTLMK